MDAKRVGDCIKRNMAEKNLTTEMLSEITGISVERLKEYEEGNLKNKAKSSEIFAISRAIGVPPLILMQGGGLWEYHGRNEDGPFDEWKEY